ncbi:MAG: O-acetylhomoserine aminocarboxypropyltransferase/cysteine synthase [Spirochaetales bacterium]|nr:O-acetylhomoserine aminocarboxypropyltransferase/cysteine synthase [Spirochaetales bacterium]MCF7938135.1 O-acetylhomoserine aminocarboxypropyltransferase/cysteine synthase [Spirochaetales bacterium]
MKPYHLETQALHAGLTVDEPHRSRAVPIHRTTAYLFRDTQHAADLFSLKEEGNIYTRIMNPTQEVLEQRMAELEGGAAALALASGTSAIFYSLITIARAGDEIIADTHLYGGTYTMFKQILPDYGITVRLVDLEDKEAVQQAINEHTRAIYVETLGNPVLSVADIEGLSGLAHENDLPLIVDSTFTTPYLMRPIEHGADVVVHSLTKWIGGHGTGIGGLVVDAGTFDWNNGRFPLMTDPDPGYHNIRYASDLPEGVPPYITRMRVVPLRNLGACIAPDNVWIFLQGLETLHLRMQRHSENAMAVAQFLEQNSRVDWVLYPGLDSHPQSNRARHYLKKGFGGMVVFGVKGGKEAGTAFIDKLQLFSHLANVGDAKSLAIHPAGTTHAQLDEKQQRNAGVAPELIRLSIGIEHKDDLIADLDQALKQ